MALADGGDEDADRLRRVRAQGAQGAGGHGGRELRGGGAAPAQGDGGRVRRRRQGDAAGGAPDGQAGGALALRAVRRGGAPLRARRYDKKAPPGYVRNVVADPAAAPLARASSTEVRYTAAFSDENPNAACAVM